MSDLSLDGLPEPDLPTQIHQELSIFLPHVLKHATDSYLDFVTKNEGLSRVKTHGGDDAETCGDEKSTPKTITKQFAEYHAACKAAAGHIELLVRLAGRIDASKEKGTAAPAPDVLDSYSSAQHDVADYHDHDDGDPEGET